MTLEYPDIYLVNVYTPNPQRDLARLPYRFEWEVEMHAYLKELDAVKSVIYCGDLNIAHKKIDIGNFKSSRENTGFTIEKQEERTALLEAGFVDTFCYFNPDLEGAYSWWSYMSKVRVRNIGWRIDYLKV